eukprot:3516397-Alexandrium_andersonii.AAC.1
MSSSSESKAPDTAPQSPISRKTRCSPVAGSSQTCTSRGTFLPFALLEKMWLFRHAPSPEAL